MGFRLVQELAADGVPVRRNTEGQTVWRSQALTDAEVVVVGDTAVLCADVSDVVALDGDETETFRMPMTQGWVRMDDGWQCLAGHAGPRQDTAPPKNT